MRNEEIRNSFVKIVWVSVGQEPNIRELQNSMHFQMTKSFLPEDKTHDQEVLQALRDAAKGQVVLLVLDDVWDPKHEKPLNCIDPDNTSRLLITTRIRGLLKKATEVDVGVLSSAEALKLLLASAEVDEGDMDEAGDELKIATEIVELCGRLPLTLAIAGGMLADSGQGFTEDILEVMKDQQELEDEDGMTVESRVISSSEKMMIKGAGKHRDMVVKVFHFFAVFPEDVPVPASFFNKMVPLLSNEKNEKKARLAVGSCLGTLLKYNLIKGSLSSGGMGVFMHDIVRDYVIDQKSEEDLRELQDSVVGVVLAARPEPQGFHPIEHALDSFEAFVARHLYWHMRQALKEGTEPPMAWLAHEDVVIIANTASAVGLEALAAFSETREKAGELVSAARCSWAATWMKGIDQKSYNDCVYRAASLLETANDKEVSVFESKVLSVAFGCEMGTSRNVKAQERAILLAASGTATFEGKQSQALAHWTLAFVKMGIFGSAEVVDLEAGFKETIEHDRSYMEVSTLTDDPSLKSFYANLMHAASLGTVLPFSPQPLWDPNQFCGEDDVVSAIELYNFHICGPKLKEVGMKMDQFRGGQHVAVLLLWYGNRDAVLLWHQKTLAAFEEIDLISSRAYNEEPFEMLLLLDIAAAAMFMFGMVAEVASLLKVLGFTLDADGMERLELYATAIKTAAEFTNRDLEELFLRLLIFLSSSSKTIDVAEVNAWMPSPQQLASLDRDYNTSLINAHDVTSFGARAFLKLGRDDDAYEVSKIAVSPEQNTSKKTTLVGCHSILGQVAAKRGDLDEADGHFANALEEAKLSRLPMLEVLAARDWKEYLLEPNGRDCGGAEAVIDGACAKMKKTREQLGF